MNQTMNLIDSYLKQAMWSTAIALATLISAGNVFAQDLWIDGDANFSYFDVNANWQDGSAPLMAFESSALTLPGTYEVWWDNITGDVTNTQMIVNGGGEVTLRSFDSTFGQPVFNYTLTALVAVDDNTELHVGQVVGFDQQDLTSGGNLLLEGLMTINNGSEVNVNSDAIVSPGSSSLSSLFVQNPGSTLNVNGDFIAAATGNVFILVRTGAAVDVDGGTFFGTGVPGGASENATVGIASGASFTTSGLMDIGSESTAFMDVFGGATVNGSEVYIGAFAGSEGELVVRQPGTEFNTSDVLFAGWQGSGILRIEDGGVVNSSDIVIGDLLPATGSVTVTGNSSQLNLTGDVLVGNDGVGTLIIDDSAQVNAGGTVVVNAGSSVVMTSDNFNVIALTGNFGLINAGEISFEAPAPDINGDLRNDALIVSNEPSITFFNDDFINNGEVFIEFLSAIRVFGSASGPGVYTGPGAINFLGDVQPGDGNGIGDIGVITIAGELQLDAFLGTAPVTQIEISGTGSAFIDRLVVGGDVILGGSLNISDLGHAFQIGDEFVFIEVGGARTGEFDGLGEGSLVTTLDGVDLFITYAAGDGNDVALTTVGGFLLGDVNLDGVVSLLDIQPFVDLLTSGGFQLEADINGDGVISLLDVAGFVALVSGA